MAITFDTLKADAKIFAELKKNHHGGFVLRIPQFGIK